MLKNPSAQQLENHAVIVKLTKIIKYLINVSDLNYLLEYLNNLFSIILTKVLFPIEKYLC